MKRLFIIVIMLHSFSMTIFSQAVTLKELIEKTKCTTYSCFNEFITKKGFNYFSSPKADYATTYIFNSDTKFTATSNHNIYVHNRCSFTLHKNGSIEITFGTSVTSTYETLIAELKTLNYKKSETYNREGEAVQVIYKSTQYPNTSISSLNILQKSELGSWTYYVFTTGRFK